MWVTVTTTLLKKQHCSLDYYRSASVPIHVSECGWWVERSYFFSSRVITIWNQLPAEVLNAVTVAAFVAKLRIISLFAIDFKLYTVGLV